MSVLFLVGAVAASIVFLWLLLMPPPGESRVHAVFGVSGSFKVLGSDMGGQSGEYFRSRGVAGVPDCVFVNAALRQVVVGEYKSRAYHKHIRPREANQLTLYMGLVSDRYRGWQVRGVLAYRDRAIPMDYAPSEFERLVALVPEFRRVRARLHR